MASPAHDDRTRIARNTASNYVVRGLTAITVLGLTPYLFRRLGVDGFGTWSVVFTIATVFSLLEWGFAKGITKYVAEYSARKRRDELDAAIGSGVVLMGALGMVALAIAAAIALLAPGLAASGEREAFQWGLILIGAAQLVRFPGMAYGASLVGYERLDLMNVAQMVTIASFPVGAVVAVESGGGVLWLSVAFAASLVLGALVWLVLLRRLHAGSIRPRLRDAGRRRQLLDFSVFALLADTMTFIATRMDTVVIAAIRGAAAAAPFGAAVRLQGGLQSLVTPFLDILMPMVSVLRARDLDEVIVRRLVIVTRVAAQIALPVGIGVALFAADITDVWLGSSAPDVTGPIIAVLGLAQIPAISGMPAQKVLMGLGRVRVIGALAALEAFMNLAISITLVATIGAIGAAIGTLVTSTFLSPLRWPLVCRAVGFPTRRYLADALLPPILASLPGIAAMLCVYALVDVGAVRLLVGLGGGIAVCLAVGVWQVGPRRTLSIFGQLRGSAAPATNTAPDPT